MTRPNTTHSQPQDKTVCERLILLNENGMARIGHGGTIGLNRLTICDDNGKVFMDFQLNDFGKPVFSMYDNGALRAALGFVGDEIGLFLCDGKGSPRTALTVTAEGVPTLSFRDMAGKRRALLGLTPNGGSILAMADHKESPRLILSNTADDPTVWLMDKRQRVIWEVAESTIKQNDQKAKQKTAQGHKTAERRTHKGRRPR
jgi:hypothetical protein